MEIILAVIYVFFGIGTALSLIVNNDKFTYIGIVVHGLFWPVFWVILIFNILSVKGRKNH